METTRECDKTTISYKTATDTQTAMVFEQDFIRERVYI